MRNVRALLVGSGAVLLFASLLSVGASCSSGQAPLQPDAGGSAGKGGSGGSSGEGGATSCGPGCYAPVGCGYTVTPPSTFAYEFFSVDTESPVTSAAEAAPVRVRLGLGGATAEGKAGYADPTTSGVFTWETTEPQPAPKAQPIGQVSNAKVQIGTSPTTLTDVHTGYTWTTPSGILATAVNMHEVHVCGLSPATTYYYQVGGGPAGKETWSATQSFTTVPATGKVTVGVFGDARDTVAVWQTVHERMKSIGVNFQLITGDIVDIGAEESEWSQWMSAIWKSGSGFLTLGEQMMIPIAGNHENESVQFYGNWSIPGSTSDGEYAKTYASFDAGNAHFVMFDDEPEALEHTTEATAQQKWLEADLAAANANRSKVPFIVVGSHRGLFSTSFHQSDPDVIQARGVLAPIFDKYHVDLVFNGHDHEYERSNLLTAGATPTGAPVVKAMAPSMPTSPVTVNSTQGTTYVINAGSGADPYPVGSGTVDYRATNQQLCVGSGCAASTYEGCYVVLELEGATLTLTAYGIQGSSTKDTVIDALILSH